MDIYSERDVLKIKFFYYLPELYAESTLDTKEEDGEWYVYIYSLRDLLELLVLVDNKCEGNLHLEGNELEIG